jgi:ATP-binding cassette, subfamily B, bacterial
MPHSVRLCLDAVRLGWRAAPGALSATAGLAVILALAPTGSAILTKRVFDEIAKPRHGPGTEVFVAVLGLTLTMIVLAVTPTLTRFAESEIGRRVRFAATDRLYHAVGELRGLRRLEEPHFHDQLRWAEQAAGMAPGMIIENLLTCAQGLLSVSALTVALTAINPLLGTVVLATAVPLLKVQLLLARRRTSLMHRLGPAERRELFYQNLLTDLGAAQEIRAFGLAGHFHDRMLRELSTVDEANRRLELRAMLPQTALVVLTSAVTGGALIWAVLRAQAGAMTVGDVSLLLSCVVGVQAGVSAAASRVGALKGAIDLFGHYRVVVNAPPDLPVSAAPQPVPVLRRAISLRDVWFRYSGEHPWVLRGVDLDIPRGATVAFVGLNGSGKSTLVKLLCRFYDPDRGSVRWDDADLRDMPIADLRERMSVVFQDFVGYELSARENIGLGDVANLDDMPRIRAAADEVGLHGMLQDLSHGYETLLTRIYVDPAGQQDGACGVLISGGQWQRLAIARAFLRTGPDLMILDEPSSGLDPDAEFELQHRLRVRRDGVTTVLISHRLNTIRNADLIAVLAEGRIAERGTHDELMATGGIYAGLFTRQADTYQAVVNS